MDENKRNRWVRLGFIDDLLKALMLRLNILVPGDAAEGTVLTNKGGDAVWAEVATDEEIIKTLAELDALPVLMDDHGTIISDDKGTLVLN